jgi:hypothetical protein
MTERPTSPKAGGVLKWALLQLSLLSFGALAVGCADETWPEISVALYCLHVVMTLGALVLWSVELRRGFSIVRCGATLLCIAMLAEVALGWGVPLLLFGSLAVATYFLTRHPRLTGSPGTRSVLKWLARVGCILIVAVWGLSFRWQFGCAVPVGKGAIDVEACSGNLWLLWFREMRLQLRQKLPECACRPASTVSLAPQWPQIREFPPGVVQFTLPCWLVLVGCAIPVYVLWRWEARSSPAGKCRRCHYDLTGNVSGLCPECGTAIPKETQVLLGMKTADPAAGGQRAE